jgi:hypothetical protein
MAEKRNVIYSETDVVSTGIGSGTVKSDYIKIDDVVETINEIRRKIKESGISPEDDDGNKKLLKRLQSEYTDFSAMHTVVLRWMVQARQYDEHAFRVYASKHVQASYESRKEYWKTQVEYLVILFKRLHPKASLQTVRNYRASVTESIKEDDKVFIKSKKEADEFIETNKEKSNNLRREKIIKILETIRLNSSS